MTKQLKEIEIPFGAKDSELCGWEYTIPEGMEATIVDDKIVVKKKESEDEKIRKWLIRTLKALNSLGVEVDGAYEMMLPTIAWLEKQVEQKSTKKIVPKHEVGDWVVSPNGVYWHIDAIQDGRYQVSSDSGDSADWPLSTNIYHRFTIKDAKDGDVLSNDHHILILRELGYSWAANGNPDSLYAYCGIKPNGNFELEQKGYCFCGTLHTHPATKEQRDTLMKAMADAGYTFDFGKKELKKIEQNPTWSEEDDDNMIMIEDRLSDYLDYIREESSLTKHRKNSLKEEVIGYVNWLKSLKDRCTWKPSDEQMMKDAIDVEVKVDAGGYPYIDKTIELYDYDKDVPLAKAGEKVKVIIMKEEQQ